MSLFTETESPLSLAAERATAPRPTWPLYGTVEQLCSAFQIDDAQLAIRQIGSHSQRDDRSQVLVLLAESQQVESESAVEIGPALRNLLGQLLAMTGDLLPATRCFRRAVDDLPEDEDQRVDEILEEAFPMTRVHPQPSAPAAPSPVAAAGLVIVGLIAVIVMLLLNR